MSARRVDGFFYGLFMDNDILRESGIDAQNPRRTYLDNFALQIGLRATLIAKPDARAYGMVYSLTHDDLTALYGGSELTDYKPEAVIVHHLETDNATPALCYNLLSPPDAIPGNRPYVARLKTVLSALDFPVDYVDSLS